VTTAPTTDDDDLAPCELCERVLAPWRGHVFACDSCCRRVVARFRQGILDPVEDGRTS
jgi:hypothetical protein